MRPILLSNLKVLFFLFVNSYTDSFKAIGVPNQKSVLEEKKEPVNQRNQSLVDLLAQSKHYNASVRKGF